MAIENNREVMAVPGKIDSPLSKGPHKLIKQGAKPVTESADIIESVNGQQITRIDILQQIINQNINHEINLTIKREQQIFQKTVVPIEFSQDNAGESILPKAGIGVAVVVLIKACAHSGG